MMMWTSAGLGKYYNINASATHSVAVLSCIELNQHKPWFNEE
jgi:hypothetical protein